MSEVAKLIERDMELQACCLNSLGGRRLLAGRLDRIQTHPEPKQSLLRAVVQVAFEAATLRQACVQQSSRASWTASSWVRKPASRRAFSKTMPITWTAAETRFSRRPSAGSATSLA